MRNSLKILILFLILASCEKRAEDKTELPQSSFDLEKEFTDLSKKITEADTVKVWMDLSLCTYQGVEKLTIIRENDSLKIQPEFAHSLIVGSEFVKQEAIKISVNDTIWKFNQFLEENKHRLSSDSLNHPRLGIQCGTTRITFYTSGLGDTGKFLEEYCNTMKRLMPNSEYHIFAQITTSMEEVEILEVEY